MQNDVLSDEYRQFFLTQELFEASKNGDVELIQSLITQGVDVRADHCEVLLHAAKADKVNVFKFLSSIDKPLDVLDPRIIYVCMENNSLAVIKFLINYAAEFGRPINVEGVYMNQFIEIKTSMDEKKLLEADYNKSISNKSKTKSGL